MRLAAKRLVIAALLAIGVAAVAHAQERRIEPPTIGRRQALIIGNSTYRTAPLKNPANDAQAMEAALRRLGFDEVRTLTNLDLQHMESAIDDFSAHLTAGSLAFFYFSGHGVQVDGLNYLLPVDFAAASASDVKYKAYPAARIQDKLEESGAKLRVLVLDACRNNPFHYRRDAIGGLAPMSVNAEGTLVAFATGDNNTADDNGAEANGLYTKHLIPALLTPGLQIHEAFRKAKEDVYLASGKKQNPSIYENVIGSYYFVAAPPTPALLPREASDLTLRAELDYWESIKDLRDSAAFEDYLRRYPQGQFRAPANARLAELRRLAVVNRPVASQQTAEPAVHPSQTQSGGTVLNGAGAADVALYHNWFSGYQSIGLNIQINYQPAASDAAIARYSTGEIDFAASDMPMTDEQIASATVKPLHFPTVLGAVVLTYNIPGLTAGLKLTADTIAAIFLGQVTRWNDPSIVASNPGIKLPNGGIEVFHRADASATTFVFSDYLSKVSAEWKTKAGTGTRISWPVGVGGTADEGVAGMVRRTPYSIGYVDFTYALRNNMQMASIRNASGKFVVPAEDGFTAAAAAVSGYLPGVFRISFTNAPGAKSYPVTTATWLVIPTVIQGDRAKLDAMKGLLKWCLTSGQKEAPAVGYAPLPKKWIDKELKQIDQIFGSYAF